MFVQSAEDIFKRLNNEPFILAFSGGKDAITMLDIAMKAKVKNITVVHFYYAPDIPSREKLLKYYEFKYGIKIHRRISWYGETVKTGQKVKQSEIYLRARKEFDISYIAEGIKQTDSIIRCTLIKQSNNGINYKTQFLYPLMRWYDSAVFAYIKQNRLILPPEYQAGVKHDLSNITMDSMQWIKRNLPADYDAILRAYPQTKDRMIHEELYGGK